MPDTVDEEAVDAFAGRLLDLVTGATQTYLIDIGRRTGLFDAATSLGPATSDALAERANLNRRYVREWLGAMASGGIFEYEASTGRYWLPREHAVCLTGDVVSNMTPLAFLATALGRHVPAVTDAFVFGGGVPYTDYLPEFHDVMEALWGSTYRDVLVDQIVPLVPGLAERLSAGARVADVACGTGLALTALGAAYPASRFVGWDLDGPALERARHRAAERGLSNVDFRIGDAAAFGVDQPLDAVFAFNAIHDQAAPELVLARIHDALAPGGWFVMDEPRLSSRLEDNIGNPFAPFLYGVSVLHCLTVSLAAGGAGLGTAWGEQVALRLLHGAGFEVVRVHEAPADPSNGIFVTRRKRS